MRFERVRTSGAWTALKAFAAVMAAGLALMFVARGRVAYRWERVRQRERVASLLDVVQSSAGAACFAEDPLVAQQVVTGLIGSRDVLSARILCGDRVLAEASREGSASGPELRKALVSPFGGDSVLGALAVVPDREEAARQGARTAALYRWIFLAALAVVGLASALFVHRSILAPLSRIQGAIRALEPGAPRRIPVPRGHGGDELGRLALEVDALVARLQAERWREGEGHRAQDPAPEEVGVAVVRGRGTLEAWSPAFAQVLGLEAPPPPGTPLASLLEEHGAELESRLAACPREGDTLWVDRGPHRVRLILEPAGGDWFRIAAARETPGARGGRPRLASGPIPRRSRPPGFRPRKPRR